MRKMILRQRLSILCATILCVIAFSIQPIAARADAVADFYRGTQVSLYVSSAPGGGYDNYARLLARHLGHHIPGAPTVVVKNMPGAGGARAANYVYNVAAKDGSNLVMPQNTLTIDQFTSTPSVKFDMRRFSWLGSMNVNQSVCIFSKRAAPIEAQDLFKRKLVIGASGGVTSSLALVPTLLNQLAGTKFEIINGYEGTNVIFLAMDRGEIEGFCGIGWDSVRVQAGERIKRGELIVGLDIGITPDAELKEMKVPFFLDLMPEGQEKDVLKAIQSVQFYGRPFAMTPDAPADRLRAMRKAFAAAMSDEALLSEAKRANFQIQYATPDQINEYINIPFAAPKQVQDRALAELRKAGWGGGQAQ
jgi:tripartite-type tricarboxylate transporter receptor subunit TctC